MHPHDTSVNDGSYIAVPLRARDGAVRAWTLIDLEDLPVVIGKRWSVRVGKYAGRAISKGGRGENKQIALLLHREILGLPRKRDGREADHKNGDGLDNRRRNLRIVSHAENMQNVRPRKGTISLHRGVTYDKKRKKWKVQVCLDGKPVFQARYDTEYDAIIAVSEARKRLLPYAMDGTTIDPADQNEQSAVPSPEERTI